MNKTYFFLRGRKESMVGFLVQLENNKFPTAETYILKSIITQNLNPVKLVNLLTNKLI